MKIVKMDKIGRMKLPKEIYRQFPEGQRFIPELKGNMIILKPIEKIKVELDDGTIIEIED